MPSLRLDSFSAKLMKGARKSSLTFAPEAGTQRLRNVINKNITDEDINKSMEIAFETGYSNIKLYFMLGLPTETDEDILGIAEIANRINEIYYRKRRNRALSINLSTAMFVPKPLTPFQWVEQISIDEMLRKQILLRNELKRIKGVKYNWHTAEVSKLEGVFARGAGNFHMLSKTPIITVAVLTDGTSISIMIYGLRLLRVRDWIWKAIPAKGIWKKDCLGIL